VEGARKPPGLDSRLQSKASRREPCKQQGEETEKWVPRFNGLLMLLGTGQERSEKVRKGQERSEKVQTPSWEPKTAQGVPVQYS
jgi:hypothetical protein